MEEKREGDTRNEGRCARGGKGRGERRWWDMREEGKEKREEERR